MTLRVSWYFKIFTLIIIETRLLHKNNFEFRNFSHSLEISSPSIQIVIFNCPVTDGFSIYRIRMQQLRGFGFTPLIRSGFCRKWLLFIEDVWLIEIFFKLRWFICLFQFGASMGTVDCVSSLGTELLAMMDLLILSTLRWQWWTRELVSRKDCGHNSVES